MKTGIQTPSRRKPGTRTKDLDTGLRRYDRVPPMTPLTSQKYIELTETYGAHNYHPLPVVIAKAKGAWVFDTGGGKYLDMLSGYSALNQGHLHPKIIKSLVAQAGRVTLTSRAFYTEEFALLARELCALAGYDMMLPMNSGAEAVETAIKTARKWGYRVKKIPSGRARVITCANNFHGRTLAIIGFSTEELYRGDFEPFAPGFDIIPFGDADALERAITPETAAFLVEPIQCEAGIIIPPPGYLSQVREICRKTGILLIFDEIQTGLGRTGRMFAWEHENAKPDILILGKALGGGVLPISAVLADRSVLGIFKPGEHGSTFGGNPLACAVARAAIKVLTDEKLADRSRRLGENFLAKLKTLRHPLIKDMRGLGLLCGIEFKPEAGGARRYCEALMKEGILCKETHDNVIRFAPPLIIKEKELNWAFSRIQKTLSRLPPTASRPVR